MKRLDVLLFFGITCVGVTTIYSTLNTYKTANEVTSHLNRMEALASRPDPMNADDPDVHNYATIVDLETGTRRDFRSDWVYDEHSFGPGGDDVLELLETGGVKRHTLKGELQGAMYGSSYQVIERVVITDKQVLIFTRKKTPRPIIYSESGDDS